MAQQSDHRNVTAAPPARSVNAGTGKAGTNESAQVRGATASTIVRYILFLGVAALVLAADQATKLVVDRTLKGASPIDLIGGLVRLDFTANTGAAFGLFRDQSALFALVALIVGSGIVIAFFWLRHSAWPVRLGLALILGGAIGNVADRIRLGYVVDFIDLRWWPVFNLADSAVVVGVMLLIIASILTPTSSSSATS